MRNARISTTRLLIAIIALAVTASHPARAIIYGSDDRREAYELTAAQQDAARSVFVLVERSVIDSSDPDDVQFSSSTLGEALGLCPAEPYWGQPDIGFCSGFQVDAQTMVTAGHCIEAPSDCTGTAFVGSLFMEPDGQPRTISVDDLYYCSAIVAREQTPDGDFVVVQLDRPVTGFAPAVVRRGGLAEFAPGGGPVIAIGHPYGIPLKAADNALIMESHEDYFECNVDTYGGNSGSAVFSADMEIVGILVRGNDDWYDNGTCMESNHCPDTGCMPPDGEGFEEAVRTNFLAPWIPPSCNDGLCDPGEDEFSCPQDCPQDSDYDFQPDETDNCPFVPNPAQENLDGDPLGDLCDCDFADGDVWRTPGEVPDLVVFGDSLTGFTGLSWGPPGEPGATGVVYDTLRSDQPFDFIGPALCLESDDGMDLVSEDWAPPPPEGCAVYYVVRAKNACPTGGTGPIGSDSFRRPRPARVCP